MRQGHSLDVSLPQVKTARKKSKGSLKQSNAVFSEGNYLSESMTPMVSKIRSHADYSTYNQGSVAKRDYIAMIEAQ